MDNRMQTSLVRQRDGWSWAAALAPAAAMLPGGAARTGWGSWLAPLLALPGVLAAEFLLKQTAKDGLANGLCCILGRKLGRLLTFIYIMWVPVLGGAQLSWCVRRMTAAVALPVRAEILMPVVVILTLWLVRGRPAQCARWAVPVLGWLLVSFGAVAVLALAQVRWDNLLPLRWDGRGLFGATATALGILCVRVYAGFLRQDTQPAPCAVRKSVTVCVLLSFLLMVTQGVLGTELAARLDSPLLTLARNVGVEGAFQRAESLLASVLLLADLALLSLLIWAVRCGAKQVWPACRDELLGVVVATVMLCCGMIFVNERRTEWMSLQLIPVVNLVLGLVIPLLLLVLRQIRQRRNGAYLVSENEENSTS